MADTEGQRQHRGQGAAGQTGRRGVEDDGSDGGLEHPQGDGRQPWRAESRGRSFASGRGKSGLGDTNAARPQRHGQSGERAGERATGQAGGLGGLANAENTDRRRDGSTPNGGGRPAEIGGPGFWSDCELIPCGDGKARRVKPGIFPVAHGVPARVGKLRAAGNAIVPQVAAEFVMAWMEV